jgi:hypothetical protein
MDVRALFGSGAGAPFAHRQVFPAGHRAARCRLADAAESRRHSSMLGSLLRTGVCAPPTSLFPRPGRRVRDVRPASPPSTSESMSWSLLVVKHLLFVF